MVEGLHLSSRHREEIVALLHKHLPGVEVWAYGSRVNGQGHEGSDLDLVLRGPQLAEIDTSRLADFIEALQDSTIPFLVEARDWARLPESFHHEVEREHVVMVEREDRDVGRGWRKATLGELGEVNRGRSRHRPRNAQYLYGGPYPFVQTGVIKASGGRVTTHSQTYSEAGLAQSRLWPANTMVITIAANIAETAVLTYPACFPDSVIGFIADESKCDVRFVEYMFRFLKSKLQHENVGTGSVQDNINLQTLDQLRFLLPPLSEQRAIAHILGTLDDKIELNRRMNETLEAMARALFKSWFVDFDPARAKMAGRDPGLPKHLADLFPDRLVDSELGEIPEGWGVKSLEMIAQLEKATVKPEDYTTEEFEHFSLPAYDSGQLPALDLGSTIKSNKTLVPSQAVLLSKLNPEIQRVWLPASASSCRQISLTEFLVFTPKPPIGRAGLYSLFNTQSFRDLLKGMVTGTSKSHQRVAPKSLAIQAMIVPADRLANKFEGLAWPVLERTLRNKSENHTLTALRDTLLPKLISGELRVKDAEQIARRAVE